MNINSTEVISTFDGYFSPGAGNRGDEDRTGFNDLLDKIANEIDDAADAEAPVDAREENLADAEDEYPDDAYDDEPSERQQDQPDDDDVRTETQASLLPVWLLKKSRPTSLDGKLIDSANPHALSGLDAAEKVKEAQNAPGAVLPMPGADKAATPGTDVAASSNRNTAAPVMPIAVTAKPFDALTKPATVATTPLQTGGEFHGETPRIFDGKSMPVDATIMRSGGTLKPVEVIANPVSVAGKPSGDPLQNPELDGKQSTAVLKTVANSKIASGGESETVEHGPRLKLQAQISQSRPDGQLRPATMPATGIVSAEVKEFQAHRLKAQTAADKTFSAGKTAIERLTERKAELKAGSQSNGDTNSGQAAKSGSRISDLIEKLAQRFSGADASQPTRPNPVALPAQANASLAANPAMRAGDLPFAMLPDDSQGDVLQLAAQTASRTIQSANGASHIAARAPQMPAGTPAEQVSVQIQHGLRNDADRINMRLYPAALGKVEIKLELSPDKTVQAIIIAEKPETLDMLARDARTLQRALEEAGLQTDQNSLSFQQGQSENDAAGFDQHDDGSETPAGAPANTAAQETATADEPSSRRAVHDGVLDVEI